MFWLLVYGNGTNSREPLCDQCYLDTYGQRRLGQASGNSHNSKNTVPNGDKGNVLGDKGTETDVGLGSESDRKHAFGDGNGVGENDGSQGRKGREGIGDNAV